MFTLTTQCIRGVLDPPVSALSLSIYRHPFLYTLCSSRFTLIINNNKKKNDTNLGLIFRSRFISSYPLQIPVITEKSLVACGYRKFQFDVMGDHLCTCTTHSGEKKTHEWVVDQLSDLFHTTHTVKTQHVTKNRGRHCGDIELVTNLDNTTGPVLIDRCVYWHSNI